MWQFLSPYEVVMHHGLHDEIMLEHLESTFGEKKPEAGRWRGFSKNLGAWFSHWRCMALFINFDFFLHSNFYRLFGTRRNGVD